LTGKMKEPVSLMANIAPARERASLHPLFHPDNAPGQIAIAIQTQGPVIDRIQDTLTDQGYTFTEISPQDHDSAMKTIQGRTHAAILAFAMTADSVPDDLETPVYRRLRSLVIDILDNNPETYAEIQAEFDGADDIAQAAAEIASADVQQFIDIYTNVSGDT
ncbi:MAG: prephenate dehydrogenase, partial [Halobacteriaceae archaeon]